MLEIRSGRACPEWRSRKQPWWVKPEEAVAVGRLRVLDVRVWRVVNLNDEVVEAVLDEGPTELKVDLNNEVERTELELAIGVVVPDD